MTLRAKLLHCPSITASCLVLMLKTLFRGRIEKAPKKRQLEKVHGSGVFDQQVRETQQQAKFQRKPGADSVSKILFRTFELFEENVTLPTMLMGGGVLTLQ